MNKDSLKLTYFPSFGAVRFRAVKAVASYFFRIFLVGLGSWSSKYRTKNSWKHSLNFGKVRYKEINPKKNFLLRNADELVVNVDENLCRALYRLRDGRYILFLSSRNPLVQDSIKRITRGEAEEIFSIRL